jgi:hypothetical protein
MQVRMLTGSIIAAFHPKKGGAAAPHTGKAWNNTTDITRDVSHGRSHACHANHMICQHDRDSCGFQPARNNDSNILLQTEYASSCMAVNSHAQITPHTCHTGTTPQSLSPVPGAPPSTPGNALATPAAMSSALAGIPGVAGAAGATGTV